MSSLQRVHLIISGDVQGVGYRAWARGVAQGPEVACLAKQDPASQEVERVDATWDGRLMNLWGLR